MVLDPGAQTVSFPDFCELLVLLARNVERTKRFVSRSYRPTELFGASDTLTHPIRVVTHIHWLWSLV